MAQPKEPPLSIRPGANRLAEVDAWATDHGLSRHAAIMALVDLGLGKGAPQPASSAKLIAGLRQAADIANGDDQPARFSVPTLGTFERKPYQKTPKKR